MWDYEYAFGHCSDLQVWEVSWDKDHWILQSDGEDDSLFCSSIDGIYPSE